MVLGMTLLLWFEYESPQNSNFWNAGIFMAWEVTVKCPPFQVLSCNCWERSLGFIEQEEMCSLSETAHSCSMY